MNRRRLTMQEREEIWRKYQDSGMNGGDFSVQRIAVDYRVSRQTIYSVLEKGQFNDQLSHKWLSEPEREEIRRKYGLALSGQDEFVVSKIAREYDVSRPTIYAIIKHDRLRMGHPFRQPKSGSRRPESSLAGHRRSNYVQVQQSEG